MICHFAFAEEKIMSQIQARQWLVGEIKTVGCKTLGLTKKLNKSEGVAYLSNTLSTPHYPQGQHWLQISL